MAFRFNVCYFTLQFGKKGLNELKIKAPILKKKTGANFDLSRLFDNSAVLAAIWSIGDRGPVVLRPQISLGLPLSETDYVRPRLFIHEAVGHVEY